MADACMWLLQRRLQYDNAWAEEGEPVIIINLYRPRVFVIYILFNSFIKHKPLRLRTRILHMFLGEETPLQKHLAR